MSLSSNKAVVLRYFDQVIDKGNLDLFDALVAPNCVIHHPDAVEPLSGRDAFTRAVVRIRQAYVGIHTSIHDLIAEDDQVVCRLTHHATHAANWRHSQALHAKPVSWSAIAIFRIRNDKIAEEWVCSAPFPDVG